MRITTRRMAALITVGLSLPMATHAHAGCRTTLESLGLSGPSLELAHELSRLAREIDRQEKNRALQDFLTDGYNTKVAALHRQIEKRGTAIDRATLDRAIRLNARNDEEKEPTPRPQENEVAMPKMPVRDQLVTELDLGSFHHRHQLRWEEGWNTRSGIPLRFKEAGRFEAEAQRAFRSSATALPNGDIVFTSSDGYLYHLHDDGAAGHLEKLDVIKIGAHASASPLVLPDGSLIVCSGDSNIYHFTLKPDGKFQQVGLETVFGSITATPAALPDGSFIVVDMAGKIYHFKSEANGALTLLDKAKVSGAITTPPLVLSDGSILFGDTANTLYRYRADSEGKLHQAWSDSAGPVMSTPTLLSSGFIVFSSLDQHLYVYK